MAQPGGHFQHSAAAAHQHQEDHQAEDRAHEDRGPHIAAQVIVLVVAHEGHHGRVRDPLVALIAFAIGATSGALWRRWAHHIAHELERIREQVSAIREELERRSGRDQPH